MENQRGALLRRDHTSAARVSPGFLVWLLVFFAFAGGLSLAFFSSNPVERTTSVAVRSNESFHRSTLAHLPPIDSATPTKTSGLELRLNPTSAAQLATVAKTFLATAEWPVTPRIAMKVPNESFREDVAEMSLSGAGAIATPLIEPPSTGGSAHATYDALQTATIPEPSSTLLLCCGALLVAACVMAVRRLPHDTSAR